MASNYTRLGEGMALLLLARIKVLALKEDSSNDFLGGEGGAPAHYCQVEVEI